MDKRTKGQRDKGQKDKRTKGPKGQKDQKDKRTKRKTGQKGKRTKGQKDKWTNGQNKQKVRKSAVLHTAPDVVFLIILVKRVNFPESPKSIGWVVGGFRYLGQSPIFFDVDELEAHSPILVPYFLHLL